jgi:hypothetical protein
MNCIRPVMLMPTIGLASALNLRGMHGQKKGKGQGKELTRQAVVLVLGQVSTQAAPARSRNQCWPRKQ